MRPEPGPAVAPPIRPETVVPVVPDAEIRSLHERYAPTAEAFELVYTHCEIVCAVAEGLIGRTDLVVDADLVRAGSLLHDIGVYQLYDRSGRLDHARYIQHGVLGHELLAGLGFPETLCRFCSCHTGVGLTRDDVRRQHLAIPEVDYLASSLAEELVMYADKFHTKTTPPALLTADTYAQSIRRFGPEKELAFQAMRARFGEPDLTALARKYGHALG